MTPEEQQDIRARTRELVELALRAAAASHPPSVCTGEAATIAVVLLLTDRLVGVLDGILSVLRRIEEHLGNIVERKP